MEKKVLEGLGVTLVKMSEKEYALRHPANSNDLYSFEDDKEDYKGCTSFEQFGKKLRICFVPKDNYTEETNEIAMAVAGRCVDHLTIHHKVGVNDEENDRELNSIFNEVYHETLSML